MTTAEDLLLSYLLNSLWQVPLLLGCAMVAARLVRPAGPSAEHRAWVGAVLAQAVLPALSLGRWDRLHLAFPWQTGAAITGESVAVQMGTGTGLGTLRLSSALMTVAAIVYAGVVLYFAIRFALRCARIANLTQTAVPLTLPRDAAMAQERCSRRFGVERVPLLACPRIFAPMTVGCVRKRVLFPSGMLAEVAGPDLDTAIAHELAHVGRNDFLKNLFYELLSLPVSYHPAFWVARQRMTETREMVCDQMAAGVSGHREYAQSLLRLASLLLEGKPLGVPHALGVFDSNTLERRLMKLTETRKTPGRLRRWAALAACISLGVAAASTVIALRFDVTAAAADDSSEKKSDAPVSISAEKMQEHLLTKVNPKYPPEAKKARIQGKVVLDAIIGINGEVENLKVVSGPTELQQSSLDAVRQWTYKPYLWHGKPVEVETTINVNYTLAK